MIYMVRRHPSTNYELFEPELEVSDELVTVSIGAFDCTSVASFAFDGDHLANFKTSITISIIVII